MATSDNIDGAPIILTNPQPGDSLTFDGTNWVNGSGSGGGGNPQMFGASRRQDVDDLLLSTEVVLGGFSFDPTVFGAPSIFMLLAGTLTDAGGAAASFACRLYDMGPPAGPPQAGDLRSTATMAVTGAPRRDLSPLISIVAGLTGVNQILDSERVYEVRGELTGDAGDLMEILWAGIQGA